MTRVRDIALTVMSVAVTLVCVLLLVAYLRFAAALGGASEPAIEPVLPDPAPISTCVGELEC